MWVNGRFFRSYISCGVLPNQLQITFLLKLQLLILQILHFLLIYDVVSEIRQLDISEHHKLRSKNKFYFVNKYNSVVLRYIRWLEVFDLYYL